MISPRTMKFDHGSCAGLWEARTHALRCCGCRRYLETRISYSAAGAAGRRCVNRGHTLGDDPVRGFAHLFERLFDICGDQRSTPELACITNDRISPPARIPDPSSPAAVEIKKTIEETIDDRVGRRQPLAALLCFDISYHQVDRSVGGTVRQGAKVILTSPQRQFVVFYANIH